MVVELEQLSFSAQACSPSLFSNLEMDGKYSAEMLKHLEKQSEVLMETYRSLSHELHRLQVEEEMMMLKFYEVTSTQELNKKNKNEKSSSSETGNGQLKALGFNPSNQS